VCARSDPFMLPALLRHINVLGCCNFHRLHRLQIYHRSRTTSLSAHPYHAGLARYSRHPQAIFHGGGSQGPSLEGGSVALRRGEGEREEYVQGGEIEAAFDETKEWREE
jgi:hypothetical protein